MSTVGSMTTAGLQAKVSLRTAWFAAHPNQPIPEGRVQVNALFDAIEDEARDRLGVHTTAEPHRYRVQCEVCGQFGQLRLSIDPQEAASAADPNPGYVYLRDSSVLGRLTDWRGGVPIIDTSDRLPGSPLSRPSDLTASRSVGEPDERFSEASTPFAGVTADERGHAGVSPSLDPVVAPTAAAGSSPRDAIRG